MQQQDVDDVVGASLHLGEVKFALDVEEDVWFAGADGLVVALPHAAVVEVEPGLRNNCNLNDIGGAFHSLQASVIQYLAASSCAT